MPLYTILHNFLNVREQTASKVGLEQKFRIQGVGKKEKVGRGGELLTRGQKLKKASTAFIETWILIQSDSCGAVGCTRTKRQY
jgi:hypothetical protein